MRSYLAMQLSRQSTRDGYNRSRLLIARRIALSGHNLSKPGYSTVALQAPGSHMPDAHISVVSLCSYFLSVWLCLRRTFDASQMNCVFALALFSHSGARPHWQLIRRLVPVANKAVAVS